MRVAAVLLAAAAALGGDLASGWIPNSLFPQGQVRAIAVPGGWRLDVVLHTRFLDRAVRSIVEKETSNWPKNHPDASAYVDGLLQARADVRAVSGGRGRESLGISFRLTSGVARVEWTTGAVAETDGQWILETPVVLRAFSPSPDYLRRNAELILQDSLRLSEATARDLLRAHGGDES